MMLPRCSLRLFCKHKELYRTEIYSFKRLSTGTDVRNGWVTSVRKLKNVCFIHINDGSKKESLQVTVPPHLMNNDITYGSCISVQGKMVDSPAKGQSEELQADVINVLGKCDVNKFPFKVKSKVIPDDIREYVHLRPKHEYIKSILRVRNTALMAIHNYFQSRNYFFVTTPILTSNDCEGAGETFTLQTVKGVEGGDESQFFGKQVYLTVSGQLHLEAISSGVSKCYTVGPTFRAERSLGRHHLSEFTMIEAELAFTSSLQDIITVMEDLVQSITKEILSKSADDMTYLGKVTSTDTAQRANTLLGKYTVISYEDALHILEKSKTFSTTKWGDDFGKPEEKYIVQECGNVPVFVTDFPTSLKPFYARGNDDGKTAAAVDLLLPEVGELFGGSLREERYDTLQEKLSQAGLLNKLDWYLNLREFGSAPHGGFGMGLDRYLQYLLNIQTVKDTTPFPRYYMHCKM